MYSYIKGIISDVESNYVVLDNSNIGYMIYVSNPYYYKCDKEYLIYLYQVIREEENALYGFKSKEERELFLKLISVKGLGPKMAIVMLSSDVSSIYEAIEKGDINYLKKFPKIGDKVARQIILDLKGKLTTKEDNNKTDCTELIDTLKALGYKPSDIKNILPNIDINKSIEQQVKDALKLLLR